MIVAEWVYHIRYYVSDGLGITIMLAVLAWAVWRYRKEL